MTSETAPEARGRFFLFRSLRILLLAAMAACLLGEATAFERLEPWTGPDLARFSLPDLSGADRDLRDYRGQTVLVHFFATWCIPCRRELPALAALAARRSASRLAILAVDVNEPDSRVKRFFAYLPVPFPVLLDRNRAVTRSWGVDVLPTTILLGPDLKPRLAVQGEVDWTGDTADQAIRSLDPPTTRQDNPTSVQGG